MEIRSNTQQSRSASPNVGLIWSARDRAIERGGVPPQTKHGGTAARGGAPTQIRVLYHNARAGPSRATHRSTESVAR